jgi:hypothetical protein
MEGKNSKIDVRGETTYKNYTYPTYVHTSYSIAKSRQCLRRRPWGNICDARDHHCSKGWSRTRQITVSSQGERSDLVMLAVAGVGVYMVESRM